MTLGTLNKSKSFTNCQMIDNAYELFLDDYVFIMKDASAIPPSQFNTKFNFGGILLLLRTVNTNLGPHHYI